MKTQKVYEHIVDLNTVWKDANHIPQTDKKVLIVQKNGRVICGYIFMDKRTFTINAITSDISNLYRWAYIDDLLPKEEVYN